VHCVGAHCRPFNFQRTDLCGDAAKASSICNKYGWLWTGCAILLFARDACTSLCCHNIIRQHGRLMWSCFCSAIQPSRARGYLFLTRHLAFDQPSRRSAATVKLNLHTQHLYSAQRSARMHHVVTPPLLRMLTFDAAVRNAVKPNNVPESTRYTMISTFRPGLHSSRLRLCTLLRKTISNHCVTTHAVHCVTGASACCTPVASTACPSRVQ
jgi:hypothetical protein